MCTVRAENLTHPRGTAYHLTAIMVFRASTSVPRSLLSVYRFRSAHVQPLRRFCASVPRSHTYLVFAPDYSDDGALARRMAVRPRHMIRANEHIKQGVLSGLSINADGVRSLLTRSFVEVAGGITTPESQDAATADKKFIGSLLLYEGDSIEDVAKLVGEDLYWTENVVSWSIH